MGQPRSPSLSPFPFPLLQLPPSSFAVPKSPLFSIHSFTTTGATVSVPYSATVPIARTGVERAVLVRRTYGVVFLGVLVTMAGEIGRAHV